MKVALIIVSYDSGEYLTKCVSHVRSQSWQPDQIVIVDNNSSDEATKVVLAQLNDCRVLQLEENLGYGGAINHVVSQLEGYDFVATLNPDAFPEPGWLEALMKAAARYPDYGSFASLMLKAGETDRLDGAGDVLHISGIPWRRYHNRLLADVTLVDEPVFSACAGAALYRLNALTEVSGFDESFFMYVEDIDLGFRLQLAGHPCRFVPDAVTEHIGSATTGADSEFTIYHGHRNLSTSYFKNMPAWLLLLTLPIHVAACLVTLVVFSFQGKHVSIWRAKKDALVDLPNRFNQRQPLTTKVTVGYVWRILQKWPFR